MSNSTLQTPPFIDRRQASPITHQPLIIASPCFSEARLQEVEELLQHLPLRRNDDFLVVQHPEPKIRAVSWWPRVALMVLGLALLAELRYVIVGRAPVAQTRFLQTSSTPALQGLYRWSGFHRVPYRLPV